MATTTDKIFYATVNTLTITLNCLASSSTAGRGSVAVDNTTNLYDDALVEVVLKTAATSTPANDKAGYIYVFGSADGNTYDGSSNENVGTDAAVTIDSPTNLKGPIPIVLLNSNSTYKKSFSVAAFFGGVMPLKWGVVVQNYSGMPLTGTVTDHFVAYVGVYYTNS